MILVSVFVSVLAFVLGLSCAKLLLLLDASNLRLAVAAVEVPVEVVARRDGVGATFTLGCLDIPRVRPVGRRRVGTVGFWFGFWFGLGLGVGPGGCLGRFEG